MVVSLDLNQISSLLAGPAIALLTGPASALIIGLIIGKYYREDFNKRAELDRAERNEMRAAFEKINTDLATTFKQSLNEVLAQHEKQRVDCEHKYAMVLAGMFGPNWENLDFIPKRKEK